MKESWVQYDKDEIEKLIMKLSKEGKPPSKIGLILRDQYGIPNVKDFGLKISTVVKSEIPEDLFNLLVKVVKLNKHLEKNKHDAKAIHDFEAIESKIRRLAKYYIRKNKLPKNWEYSIERAKLLVK